MSVKCPKCQTNNPDTQKFCGECGANLRQLHELVIYQTKTLKRSKKDRLIGKTIVGRLYWFSNLSDTLD